MYVRKLNSTVQRIEDYIRDHNLKPGDPLPSESVLCDVFHCSRSSLREAMRILATLDVVTIRHGYGTFVSEMSLTPLVDGLVFRLSLSGSQGLPNLEHVIETRIALDKSIAAELVALLGGKDDPQLREIVNGMRKKLSSGQSFTEEDHAFHKRLLRDLNNPLIRELSEALWAVHQNVVPLLNVSAPAETEDIEATVEAHAGIVDALVAQDIDAYIKQVDAHYAPLMKAVQRAKQAV